MRRLACHGQGCIAPPALHARLYTGWYEWNGKLILGRRQAIISVDLWERVQSVLEGGLAKKRRRAKHDFAFSGLISCGACGCSVVGVIKKKRYVREEVLETRFTELLGRLRLGERINAMYIDKLDGQIGGDFYDRFAGEWREEQLRLQREIDRHESAEQSYMDEGVKLLELAQSTQPLFERQEPRQKRRLLNFLLSNCTWADGEMTPTFRQPIDLLAETNTAAARQGAVTMANYANSEIWLTTQSLKHQSALSHHVKLRRRE